VKIDEDSLMQMRSMVVILIVDFSFVDFSSRYRVNEQNLALERAQRTVAETEEIGNETIKELERNREVIEGSREKV
jgi:hypothetical protein